VNGRPDVSRIQTAVLVVKSVSNLVATLSAWKIPNIRHSPTDAKRPMNMDAEAMMSVAILGNHANRVYASSKHVLM
jgi:hypothetical protein